MQTAPEPTLYDALATLPEGVTGEILDGQRMRSRGHPGAMRGQNLPSTANCFAAMTTEMAARAVGGYWWN